MISMPSDTNGWKLPLIWLKDTKLCSYFNKVFDSYAWQPYSSTRAARRKIKIFILTPTSNILLVASFLIESWPAVSYCCCLEEFMQITIFLFPSYFQPRDWKVFAQHRHQAVPDLGEGEPQRGQGTDDIIRHIYTLTETLSNLSLKVRFHKVFVSKQLTNIIWKHFSGSANQATLFHLLLYAASSETSNKLLGDQINLKRLQKIASKHLHGWLEFSYQKPGARFTNFQELFLTWILNAILNRLRIDS
jgi:hypothetical protein